MKKIILMLLVPLFAHAGDFPVTEEDKAAILKGLASWEQFAATQGELSDEEYLERLSVGLRKTSQSAPYFLGDREGAHLKIRDRMVSIPGHAEYFGEKAWKLYRNFKRAEEEGDAYHHYVPYIEQGQEALETLALLPSADSVRVLGGMLKEDWKRAGSEAAEERGDIPYTFGMRALSAFSKMPIANPPSKPIHHNMWIRDNIGTWRDWYAEIESGRRTFRFIGDPVEYDLRGPVRRGAMDDRSRGTKRPGGVPAGKALPARTEQGPKGFLPYVFGALFLLAGLFIYLRGKRNAA